MTYNVCKVLLVSKHVLFGYFGLDLPGLAVNPVVYFDPKLLTEFGFVSIFSQHRLCHIVVVIVNWSVVHHYVL